MNDQRKNKSARSRGARRSAVRAGESPDPVSHLIESLDRQGEWMSTLERQAEAFHVVKSPSSAFPDLKPADLLFLKQHAIRDFLQTAQLGRRETALFERHCGQPADKLARENFVVMISDVYARAIGRATGNFAEILTQTLLSRRRRVRLTAAMRSAILREAIQYAIDLSGPSFLDSWLGTAQAPIFLTAEGSPFQEEKTLFQQRIKIHQGGWSREADSGITFSFLRAGGRYTPIRTNPLHCAIARVLVTMLDATDEDICLELDRQNERALSEGRKTPFPVPESLKRVDIRLWVGPFRENEPDLVQDIHELLSKIRRKFGLRDTDPKPNPLPFPQKTKLAVKNALFSTSGHK